MQRILTQAIILQITLKLQGIMDLSVEVEKETSNKIRGFEPGLYKLRHVSWQI